MTTLRLATFFLVATAALTPSLAHADGQLPTYGLSNSPSIQARIENQWEKTHPMNNSRAEYSTAQNPTCQTSFTSAGARMTTCH